MKSEMTERYIYAVTKQLPQRLRQDVGDELRGLIEDMLAERCGEMPPAEKDVRVVLTELGTPAELAGQYSPDKNQSLIGQPYYSTYKLVLKIVLLCVLFGMTLAKVIEVLSAGGSSVWYMALLGWLGNLVAGATGGFAWVTLIFVVFQRLGVKLESGFSLDDLPDPPEDKDKISRWEPLVGLVFFALFVVAFLFVPELLRAVVDGEVYPVFNVELMRARWPVVVLMGLVGIAECSFQLYEGRHTPRLDLFSLASNLVCAVLFVVLLTGPGVLAPEMLAALAPEFHEFPLNFVQHFNLFFLGIVLLAIAVDSVSLVVRLVRSRHD